MESVPHYCEICKKTHVPDGRHDHHGTHDRYVHHEGAALTGASANESCNEGAGGCARKAGIQEDDEGGDSCDDPQPPPARGAGGCGCCGNEEPATDFSKPKTWLPIIIGAAILGVGLLFSGALRVACFFVAYVLLGGSVLKQAWLDMKGGHVFGESLLMGIATLGAFAIGEYTEAVGVMLFYRIGEYFQELAVDKSRRSISEIVNLRPETAQVMRDGAWVRINPAEAAVGESMMVEPGERIALDGIVRAGESRIDFSALTGESVPVGVGPGKEIMAGGVNQSSPLTVEITRPLMESASSRVLRAVEDAAQGKPRLENFITRFSKIYTPIVVVLAVLLAVIPPLAGLGVWKDWLYRALMFLVISCPCALVLSVPLTFFAGLARASSHGVLFKGANRMEALATARAAVLDKTGTLTEGVFNVQQVLPANSFSEKELLGIAAAAEHHSPHPVAKAIRDAAGVYTPCEDVEEIAGHGVRATMDGKEVLVGNAKLLARAGITPQEEQTGTVAYVAADGVYAGCVVIADKVKSDAARAVAMLNKDVGYTAILTGDTKGQALDVARQTGVRDCYYQLLPEEKLAHLQDIRSRYGRVIFVGDGINDAPVLMGADVGIAIGVSGADMAVEAADVVLLNEELTAIPDAVAISCRTMRIARENIIFALAVKTLAMVLGTLGIADMWMAVFADVGTAFLCVLNALRLLARKPGKKNAAPATI
ncbi:MAG: cadmium-translocating P-type ATPase [Clostridiales bacterium]|nr:cadmium-translocating P-type ATPase [Clostridiales bacterium]